GLNPFGTGQCLSTKKEDQVIRELKVSIPLEQGNVFRLTKTPQNSGLDIGLNPFGTGQCLSTAVGCSSLVWQGFPEPLPNFFLCLKS
ncbi:hypothetical protein, partial [Haemophilus haemolyticus]|uniref:hypothetical protein n=1 Tax=Haemophilus haemolyticus TaxID=726 RepID=UPI001E6569FF